MKHQRKIILLVLGLLVAALSAQLQDQPQPVEINTAPLQEAVETATSTIRATRVVDGDTIEIFQYGKYEKIRMLGIDTPESVDPRKPVQCFAKEATARLKELIMEKDLILTPDMTNDDRDKYGRLLRYVALTDGTSVNAEMIRQGYAYAYIKFPFEQRAEYLKLQTEARDAGRGLWATTTCHGRR